MIRMPSRAKPRSASMTWMRCARGEGRERGRSGVACGWGMVMDDAGPRRIVAAGRNQKGCPAGAPLLIGQRFGSYEAASSSAARNSLVSSSSACRASSSPS